MSIPILANSSRSLSAVIWPVEEKPQFFLEVPCLVPFEKLKRNLHEKTPAQEFTGHIELTREGENQQYSRELACFLLLAESGTQ